MKKYIGRKEYVSFPDIGLQKIKAKIDTGAYSSSIHCHSVKEVTIKGQKMLRAIFPDADENDVTYEFSTYERTRVRSSSGKAQERYLVKVNIRLGKKVYHTAVTLANRSKMKYPVLLGRKLLNKRFVVDVSEQYILKS